jgi:hypothetical protein
MRAYYCFFCFFLSLFGAFALWILSLLSSSTKQDSLYLLLWFLDSFGGLLSLGLGLYFDPFPAYVEETSDEA